MIIYTHNRDTDTTMSFRKAANKKERNKLTGRISQNAEKLARDMWQLLMNRTLDDEILEQYAEVVNEITTTEVMRFLEPSLLPDVNIDNFHFQEIDFNNYTDITRLCIHLKTLSEAAKRTNKSGLGLSTNKETGLPRLSETINKVLKKLKNSDGSQISKSETAAIICEIFSSVNIDGGSSISISKNIS